MGRSSDRQSRDHSLEQVTPDWIADVRAYIDGVHGGNQRAFCVEVGIDPGRLNRILREDTVSRSSWVPRINAVLRQRPQQAATVRPPERQERRRRTDAGQEERQRKTRSELDLQRMKLALEELHELDPEMFAAHVRLIDDLVQIAVRRNDEESHS